MKLLALILWCGWSSFVGAQSITSHSQQSFSIFEGETAQVFVASDIAPNRVEWVLSDKVIGSNLKFETLSSWTAGYYALSAYLFFNEVTLKVPFYIQIVPNLNKKKISETLLIAPTAKNSVAIETITNSVVEAKSKGDYSKINFESGETKVVGDRASEVDGKFYAQTSAKSIFMLKKAKHFRSALSQNGKVFYSIEDTKIALTPITGSVFLKKNKVPIEVNLPIGKVVSSSQDLSMIITENIEGEYSIVALAGALRLEIGSGVLEISEGDGFQLEKESIYYLSHLGCSDRNLLGSEKFELVSGCRVLNAKSKKVVGEFNRILDSYLDISSQGNDIVISYKEPENDFLLADVRITDGILNNTSKRSLEYPEDQQQLVDVAYQLLKLRKAKELELLYKSVEKFGSPVFREVEAMSYMIKGDCESFERSFQESSSEVFGIRFHYLSALSLYDCGHEKEALLRFDDVVWWAEDEALKNSAQSNFNFIKNNYNSKSRHEVFAGYSTNPSGVNLDYLKSLNAEAEDAGYLLGYEYNLQSEFVQNEASNIIGTGGFQGRFPVGAGHSDYSTQKIHYDLGAEIYNVISLYGVLDFLELSVFFEPGINLNLISGSLASSQFDYSVGMGLNGIRGKPGFYLHRTLTEDATDEPEFKDFALNTVIEQQVNQNNSNIISGFGLRLGECLSVLCSIYIEQSNIVYHRDSNSLLDGSIVKVGFDFSFAVAEGFSMEGGADYSSFSSELDSSLTSILVNGHLLWNLLPRNFAGVKLEYFSNSSDIEFMVSDSISILGTYRIESF